MESYFDERPGGGSLSSDSGCSASGCGGGVVVRARPTPARQSCASSSPGPTPRGSQAGSPRGQMGVRIGNEWRRVQTRPGRGEFTNEWTLFVRPSKEESPERFAQLVRKVVFRPASGFYPAFRPQVVEISSPGPFEVTRRSQGVFDAEVKLHLDPAVTAEPCRTFVHFLQFGQAVFYRRHMLRLPPPGQLESSAIVASPLAAAAAAAAAAPLALVAASLAIAAAAAPPPRRQPLQPSPPQLPAGPPQHAAPPRPFTAPHSESPLASASGSFGSQLLSGEGGAGEDASKTRCDTMPQGSPQRSRSAMVVSDRPLVASTSSLRHALSVGARPAEAPPYEGSVGGEPVDITGASFRTGSVSPGLSRQQSGATSTSAAAGGCSTAPAETAYEGPLYGPGTERKSDAGVEVDAILDVLASAAVDALHCPQEAESLAARLRADAALRRRVGEAVFRSAARLRAPADAAAGGKEVPMRELRIGAALGSGHFGCVHHAEWRGLPVAVKEVRSPAAAWRFGDEVKSLLSLRHPNIVAYLGHTWAAGGSLLLITEYCVGGSLEAHLATRAAGEEPLCVGEVLDVARDVAQAMHYLECEGKVHRDLASRNVFVAAIGNGSLSCKVGDFGLARDLVRPTGVEPDRADDDAPAADDLDMFYMRSPWGAEFPVWWTAPEVLRSQRWTHAGDVWSYGVLLWEVLDYAGRVPWRDTHAAPRSALLDADPLPRPEGCPDLLWGRLCQPALSQNPAERPSFSRALEDALRLRKSTAGALPEGVHTRITLPKGAHS
eukprot:TRINITY_DN11581_c0_g1_i1.p1 TRINITY_DN11581_c0_g1~~TRINITY_DN11581_c0_g1_i1.p1  ORF type:complete len:777 (+),score=164.02 TRINITY_DN11581_c0_g1_i1:100-2430(+)